MTSAVVINTNERAVSLDIIRLQLLAQRDIAEASRYLNDAFANEVECAGVATVGSSINAPARAHIVNGIMARPEIGTTNMFIDPGVIGMIDVDAQPSSDKSFFKIIVDPGVLSGGVLVMTANTSGSTRIDVVECQRAPDVVQEVDSRDIFDDSTGLFTAVSVPKVISDRLNYRIRLGVPASGYPAAVAGWLPLAVCRVPNAAATWDDCFLWDVRPLISDLARASMTIQDNHPMRRRQHTSFFKSGSNLNFAGHVDVDYQGRRVGGTIAPSGGSYIDLATVTDPSMVLTANRPLYVYLMFPGFLPRWCAYTPATSGARKPGSLRGLLAFSHAPESTSGVTQASFNVPASYGLTIAGTSNAICIATTAYTITPEYAESVAIDGEVHICDPSGAWLQVAPATSNFGTKHWTYTFIDGTTHPTGANELLVEVHLSLGSGTPGFINPYSLTVALLNGSVSVFSETDFGAFSSDNLGGASQGFIVKRMWIPLDYRPDDVLSGYSRTIDVQYSGLDASLTLESGYPFIRIIGWRTRR